MAQGDSFLGVGASRKTAAVPGAHGHRGGPGEGKGLLMLLNPMWVVEAAEPESSRLKTKAF